MAPKSPRTAAASLRHAFALAGVAALPLLAGCQGDKSQDPPIHPNLNMDFQDYYKPQEKNDLFADKRAARKQVPGTVPVGHLNEDDYMYRGLKNGELADVPPMPVTNALLQRGQNRYNIYCIHCHGGTGAGDGIAVKRGMLAPPSFHDERLRAAPAGYIYQVQTYGVRNMMPYASQITPEDRWAIVAYVRALQLSQNATLDQVPAEVAASNGWSQK